MNRRITFVIVIFISALIVRGADFSVNGFEQANRLYESGKFSEALEKYLELNSRGEHWKLYYNIGNCYFKLDQLVRAKIFYLKAKRLKPFNSSVKRNIEITNKKLNDKIPAKKPDFISKIFLRIESFISLNFISLMLFFFVIVLNVFIFVLLKKGKKKFIIYGISFSFLITVLISVYHVYRVGKYIQRNTAVITESSDIRSGPGENNTILFKVNPGLEVKIIDRGRNWFQVSASSEIAGWVKKESLEQI